MCVKSADYMANCVKPKQFLKRFGLGLLVKQWRHANGSKRLANKIDLHQDVVMYFQRLKQWRHADGSKRLVFLSMLRCMKVRISATIQYLP